VKIGSPNSHETETEEGDKGGKASNTMRGSTEKLKENRTTRKRGQSGESRERRSFLKGGSMS